MIEKLTFNCATTNSKNVTINFHIRVNEVCDFDWLKHFDKWNKYMIETAKKHHQTFFLQSVKYHLKIEKIYEYKHSNINSTKIYIFFFFSKRKPNNLFFYTKTRLNYVPPSADYFITYNLTIKRQSWTQMQYKKCKNNGHNRCWFSSSFHLIFFKFKFK